MASSRRPSLLYKRLRFAVPILLAILAPFWRGRVSAATILDQIDPRWRTEMPQKVLDEVDAIERRLDEKARTEAETMKRDQGSFDLVLDTEQPRHGSNLVYFLVDKTSGHRYAFKVSSDPYKEAFVSKLYEAMGFPRIPVMVHEQVIPVRGRSIKALGTLRPILEHTGKTLSTDTTKWTDTQRERLLRDYVRRRLVLDLDKHKYQYLIEEDGSLRDIDYDHAFEGVGPDEKWTWWDQRHFVNPDIVNKAFSEFIQGRYSAKSSTVAPHFGIEGVAKVLSRIASFPPTELEQLYRDHYASKRWPNDPAKQQQAVTAFLQHHANYPKKMQDLFQELYEHHAASNGLPGAPTYSRLKKLMLGLHHFGIRNINEVGSNGEEDETLHRWSKRGMKRRLYGYPKTKTEQVIHDHQAAGLLFRDLRQRAKQKLIRKR